MFIIFLAACGFDDDTDEGTSDAPEEEETSEETETEETEETDSGDGNVLNLFENSELPTMDSSHAHDSAGFTTLNNTNEGLYRSDENHEPQLALAEEHDMNDDETVHTFTLRDAKWSNGEEVTAHDFEYAWKRVYKVAGHYSDMFVTANVENVQAILDEEMD